MLRKAYRDAQLAPSTISYIETHDDALIDLRVERPSLEDRFLEITHSGGKK